MNVIVMNQRKKIHPHMFTLWDAIASIIMMFAGLTSAYIVKRSQANWMTFDLPKQFWYSTIVILLSSLTLFAAKNALVNGELKKYKYLTATTFLLGSLFVVLQISGFSELWKNGLTLTNNVSISFLYVIVGLHGLHVIGGIIALLILLIQSYMISKKNDRIISVEVMSTYWHFVDALWIYLLIFLFMIR
jgi:cytochrome c oxidase subunit III